MRATFSERGWLAVFGCSGPNFKTKSDFSFCRNWIHTWWHVTIYEWQSGSAQERWWGFKKESFRGIRPNIQQQCAVTGRMSSTDAIFWFSVRNISTESLHPTVQKIKTGSLYEEVRSGRRVYEGGAIHMIKAGGQRSYVRRVWRALHHRTIKKNGRFVGESNPR